MADKIAVSETFLSVQGEGSTVGCLSVFLRVQGCDFMCKWCDTIPVWQKGTVYTHEQLFDIMEKNGSIEALKNDAHLILTGGNPLIRQQELLDFIIYLRTNKKIYWSITEVETQGNVVPNLNIDSFVSQYNISPKLANSGMPKEKRIVPDAINFFLSRNARTDTFNISVFKFVVRDEADVQEAINDYIKPFKIPNRDVYLMPCAASRAELATKSQPIVELCKKYHFNYGARMHLDIWDKATGV